MFRTMRPIVSTPNSSNEVPCFSRNFGSLTRKDLPRPPFTSRLHNSNASSLTYKLWPAFSADHHPNLAPQSAMTIGLEGREHQTFRGGPGDSEGKTLL